MDSILVKDNGGRRTGVDRRQFSYSIHVPERRSGEDRRSGVDRRATSTDYMWDKERRIVIQKFNP